MLAKPSPSQSFLSWFSGHLTSKDQQVTLLRYLLISYCALHPWLTTLSYLPEVFFPLLWNEESLVLHCLGQSTSPPWSLCLSFMQFLSLLLSIPRLFTGKQEGKKQMKALKAMQTNMPVFPPMDPCRCGAYHSTQCLIRRENMGRGGEKGKIVPKDWSLFLPIIVVETESPIALSGFELLFKDSDVQTKI